MTTNDGDREMSNENEALEPKSKQQQKREAEAVQALGTALVRLPATHFDVLVGRLVLPEQLREALMECRAIKAHEGRRRQLQYIGKLMRGIDAAPIQQMLAELARDGHAASARLHDIERWRERLLADGDEAFKELVQTRPEANAAQLRKLVVAARKELAQNQPPRAARMLFKCLRELLA